MPMFFGVSAHRQSTQKSKLVMECSKIQQKPEFVYTALDQRTEFIRVLNVLPGQATSDVECVLSHQTYLTCVVYDCLSYVWGDTSDQAFIIVNGAKLQIRSNLFQFLLMARSTSKTQAFWIDAICIDQSNITERSHQVQQMARIYDGARHAIVWLGSKNARHHADFSALRSAISKHGTDPNHYEHYRHILGLYQRVSEFEYFSRLWIVQEIVLSHSSVLYYDQVAFSWNQFRNTLQDILAGTRRSNSGTQGNDNRHCLTQSKLLNLCTHSRPPKDVEDDATIPVLIHSFGTCECSDKRDRVYGLLGLTNRRTARQLEVNYDEPAAGLFLRTREYCYKYCEKTSDRLNFETDLISALQLTETEVVDHLTQLRSTYALLTVLDAPFAAGDDLLDVLPSVVDVHHVVEARDALFSFKSTTVTFHERPEMKQLPAQCSDGLEAFCETCQYIVKPHRRWARFVRYGSSAVWLPPRDAFRNNQVELRVSCPIRAILLRRLVCRRTSTDKDDPVWGLQLIQDAIKLCTDGESAVEEFVGTVVLLKKAQNKHKETLYDDLEICVLPDCNRRHCAGRSRSLDESIAQAREVSLLALSN